MTAKPRPSQSRTLNEVERLINDRLPDDWTLAKIGRLPGKDGPDLVTQIVGPNGESTHLIIEYKQSVLPRDVPRVVAHLRADTERLGYNGMNPVLVSPYLSETTREIIAELGANYADTTGNVLLRLRQPALYVKTEGASRDPWPSDETLRSLRGRGAGRAVRALVDFRPPYGVREIAVRADVALGSMSRVVDLLEREGVIKRVRRGPITDVDWQGVIRRWAKDYDVAGSNQISTFLEPRGFTTLIAKLANLRDGYAATGVFAAQHFSPIAPTRLAAIYTNDVDALSERLDLRPADVGANVWLIEPYDQVVFDRTSERDGIVCVNPTQLAVDLLGGPGRDPAEGEELINWMKENDDAWRI